MTNFWRLCAVILLTVVLTSCEERPAVVTISELEMPDWPLKAAGVGPSHLAVTVATETPIEICPTDPFECETRTIAPGSWVIEIDVPDDAVWHVRIY